MPFYDSLTYVDSSDPSEITGPWRERDPEMVVDARTTALLEATVAVRQYRTGEDALLLPIEIPADRILPGPRTHRFHVVDIDLVEGRTHEPVHLSGPDGDPLSDGEAFWYYADRFSGREWSGLEADRAFRAQQLLAVASRTLGLFEAHLGRRVPWAFESPTLFLVPRGLRDINAYYSRDHKAVVCGYTPEEEGRAWIFTALSHDIVTHEVCHAILDGLRPRLIERGLPDQAAFHEALADVVALLSVAMLPGAIVDLVPDFDERVAIKHLRPSELRKSDIFALAPTIGEHVRGQRGLRRSALLRPNSDWQNGPDWQAPHRRAEILVAAVMYTFTEVWSRRTVQLHRNGTVDRLLALDEGAKAAAHVLGMCVRALDWLPPVEVEFADFLGAILDADEELVPDDHYGYREAFTDAFDRFGIERAERRLRKSRDLTPVYSRLNFAALRTDTEEVYRYIWHNAHLLGIDLRYQTDVERVFRATRTGPDGLVIESVVADYTQRSRISGAELGHTLGLGEPAAGDQHDLWGGGVLIFDQFGQLHTHVHKSIGDMDRHRRRLENRQLDPDARSAALRHADLLYELHEPAEHGAESW